MHREFISLLQDAVGSSQPVVAINLDIRGFSAFSQAVDSHDAAIFISRVYRKLIEQYFPDSSFVKPTGDGLLVVVGYSEKDVNEIMAASVKTCVDVVRNFPAFLVGDSMISFDVPKKIGIGLSRGTACRLFSERENKTLDYSGRVLNSASRLMGLARPSGVVFDASIPVEVLPPQLQDLFSVANVYLQGISEERPVQVHHTADVTIPNSVTRPIGWEWKELSFTYTLSRLRAYGTKLRVELPTQPADPMQIKAYVTFPSIWKGRKLDFESVAPLARGKTIEYVWEAGTPYVDIVSDKIVSRLEDLGAKDGWKIKFRIMYPVRS
jgi:class 3 adenylate cyclase